MSILKSFERDDLKDNQYGIPSLRKYPLTDEEHVRKAVQFFKYADRKHQKQLRDNIIRRAKELNMDYSDWSINESFQDASNKNSEEVIEVLNVLHDKLCKFEYGIPIKGKMISDVHTEEFMNDYFSLSPDNFVKYGGGVCWDFTEYERDYLEKQGITYRQIYIIAQTKECPTHTFIVCESEGKFIYIEYSFERVSSMIHGVKSFDSLEDICKLVTTMMFGCNDSLKELEKFRYEVREFFDHPPYNSTCEEYMEWMTNNSKLIDRGWAYKSDYENIISESYVQEATSKKEQHRIDNFLKRHDYDPKTETIKTDIDDGKGDKLRTKFKIDDSSDAFGSSIKANFKDKGSSQEYIDGSSVITLDRNVLKRKPPISDFELKHEEGHLDQYKNPDKYKNNTNRANYFEKQSLHNQNIDNAHVSKSEFLADKYASEHNKNHTKSSILRTMNTLKKNDIYMNNIYRKQIKILQNVSPKILFADRDKYVKGLIADMKYRINVSCELRKMTINNKTELEKEYDSADDMTLKRVLKVQIECEEMRLLKIKETGKRYKEELVHIKSISDKINSLKNDPETISKMKDTLIAQYKMLIEDNDKEVEMRKKFLQHFIKESFELSTFGIDDIEFIEEYESMVNDEYVQESSQSKKSDECKNVNEALTDDEYPGDCNCHMVQLNKESIDCYKNNSESFIIGLNHLRLNDDITGVILCTRSDDIIGYVAVETKPNGERWITGLEVVEQFQSHGYDSYLFNIAKCKFNANRLSVNKKNEEAYRLYTNNGWKIYEETQYMYLMKPSDEPTDILDEELPDDIF